MESICEQNTIYYCFLTEKNTQAALKILNLESHETKLIRPICLIRNFYGSQDLSKGSLENVKGVAYQEHKLLIHLMCIYIHFKFTKRILIKHIY